MSKKDYSGAAKLHAAISAARPNDPYMVALEEERATRLGPTVEEQLAILRRSAERGLQHASEQWVKSGFLSREWNTQIDCWQHVLDELSRTWRAEYGAAQASADD